MPSSDGMTHAPKGKPAPVCKSGDFPFAAVALDHGHIYGQCNGLIEAGATLKAVFDPDPTKVRDFVLKFPGVRVANSIDEILNDPEILLVAAAAVPSERGPLGCRVMEHDKDYFTDKTPFTTVQQLDAAKSVVNRTNRKYMVYYSERLHVECAVLAGQLIEEGVIGNVIQVIGTGPHRLSASSRPDWFFQKEKFGGILCDIGSHQSEQFLFYTKSSDAVVNFSAVANFGNPSYPEFEDFGEASLTGNSGASGYYRVDWFTPDALRSWGDGRTFILGTRGHIELRKYIEVAAPDPEGEQLILVTGEREERIACKGKIGYPFFGQLILDCLNRTETAMTQAHAFKAAELCLAAQNQAVRINNYHPQ